MTNAGRFIGNARQRKNDVSTGYMTLFVGRSSNGVELVGHLDVGVSDSDFATACEYVQRGSDFGLVEDMA